MDEGEIFKTFLQVHQPQLESCGVPKIFWKTLFTKLRNNTFDVGTAFQLIKIDYEGFERKLRDPAWKLFVSHENGISAQDPNNIYLINIAWAYNVKNARQNLLTQQGLLDRMYYIMGIESNNVEEQNIDYVLKEMWKYNQFFSFNIGSVEDRLPIWYIMDEVGSAINHSDYPNFRTVPFVHSPEDIIYILLFPLKDVNYEEEVTRDFVEGQTKDVKKRQALLLPWVETSFLDDNFIQTIPDNSYFLVSNVLQESLPEKVDTQLIQSNRHKKLRVFSQYTYINNYLTDPAFEIVDNEDEADILWYTSHFKNYKELSIRSPHVYVNQFAFEIVLTIKDLLPIICRRSAGEKTYNLDTLEPYPEWLPTTYNLITELVPFVAYFQHREKRGLNNYWICKPWNLARSLDVHVTNNLFHILRLPSTGPKIAQKYVTNPVLYNRPEIGKVKFDIRYEVLLKSVKPLKVFVYKNFMLRFANKEFALNNFDVYEQHFTVMNYAEGTQLFYIKCADFILEWEKQYSNFSWREDVEPKIWHIFQEVFKASVAEDPPKGIAHCPQSRALYAIDLILEWRKGTIQPILLEVNFCPDCKRFCEDYPNFYNDIFKCLFLDDNNPEIFHDLSPETN